MPDRYIRAKQTGDNNEIGEIAKKGMDRNLTEKENCICALR